MKPAAYFVVSELCWMSKVSGSWAVGETVGGQPCWGSVLPRASEHWHYSSTEGCLVCTYLGKSLLSVPVILSEPVPRPRAILTQDLESSVLMWVLEHWLRLGDPTVSTDLWCVLWVVWLCSRATQRANGDLSWEESCGLKIECHKQPERFSETPWDRRWGVSS